MINFSAQLAPGVLLRAAALDDAAGLARSLQRSRDHLRPWDPVRDEAFFTTDGQRARLRALLADQQAGRAMPWVLVHDMDGVIGAATLTGIALGPFRSATLGYWIDAGHVRRGLATAAVREVCAAADTGLGLHRLQAGTLVDNVGSQRVLAACGFERIGTARNYLHIAGAWRDHHLFQRILNDREP